MTEDIEKFVARSPEKEFHPVVATSPNEIMMEAVRKGFGKDQLEVLERMFDFDLKVKAQQAKEAFYEAKAAFKSEVPVVIKDKKNQQYNSMYATEDALFNTVNPVLAKHGLEASFSYPKSEDPKMFIVRCTLTHTLGHSEFVDADGPLDTSGSKNPLQQYKSTRTYLKKESYTAITGIASADSIDDDGNSAGEQAEFINLDQQTIINKRIAGIYKDKGARFLKWLSRDGKKDLGIDSVDKIPTNLYKKAVSGLDDAEAKLNAALNTTRKPGEEG